MRLPTLLNVYALVKIRLFGFDQKVFVECIVI